MRPFRFALALVCAGSLNLVGTPVLAQIAPSDPGAGVLRGIQDQGNSGQVGTVDLFARGAETLVVLDLHGEPRNVSESAHLHRGTSCATLNPAPVFPLSSVRNGRSSTLVRAPIARLTSGNYVVNVHSASNPKHYVACGELTPGS